MKKIITYLFLFFFLQNFAQESAITTSNKTSSKTKNEFGIDGVWRLYPTSAKHFGNNAFAKAHEDGSSGLGTSFALLKYGNFRAGLAYELTKYSVSDVSKVGNFANSNNQTFTWFISYDYRLNKTFVLVPNIGYGSSYVNQRSKSKRFGHYSGNHFRLGVQTDAELGTSVAVFVGIHYISTKYSIKTNAEFQDYFQKSQQIQLSFGLKIF
jgi:hypothetical protein